MLLSRPKILLLDIDGVVLQAPKALGRVAQRACDFVARDIGASDRRYATRVNRLLYTQHGHTLLGLQRLYGSRSTSADFADFVYDDDTMALLRAAKGTPEFEGRAKQVRAALRRVQDSGVPIYLFSNAPLQWCKTVYDMTNLYYYLPEENIFYCDHPVFAGGLKPQPAVYKNIQMYLDHEHRMPDADLVFVDDSYCNLVPVLDSGGGGTDGTQWSPIFFNPRGPAVRGRNLTTVKDMEGITRLVVD